MLVGAWLLAGGAAAAADGAPVLAAAAAPAAAPPPAVPLAAAAPADVTRTDLSFASEERRREWHFAGAGYDVGFDPRESRAAGGQSLRLALRPGAASGGDRAFGVASTRFGAEAARGRHLRLEGWIKSSAISRGWAGLWVRIDGPGGSLALDNMADRGVRGTTPWTRVEVELDVPQAASAIYVGALLAGDGTVWASDLALFLEPIRPAVPVVLEGRVQDPAGRPVGGALVAVVPAGSGHPAAVVKSGGDGMFRASVARGSYALTATAAGFTAAFLPPIDVREPGPSGVALMLAAGGVRLTGRIESGGGAPPPAGTRVEVSRFSDERGDVFCAELDGAGAFSLGLSPARYAIALGAADYVLKPLVAEIPAGGPDQRVTLSVTRLGPAPEEVVSWLRGHVVPLRTVTAGQGFDDLRPLAAVVGKARIVALGEATHGTREFFQLKHRLLEYLVAELGFTVFAIEANWPESLAVDDYVMRGSGDPAKALAGLYFWTWNTEEVLDMIRWMRAYNADPAHARKVRFLGFDMQATKVAGPVVAAYLGRVDPAYAKQMSSPLVTLGKDLFEATPAESGAALAAAKALLARFDEQKAAYVAASSPGDWDLARQHAVILEQAAELAVTKRFDSRDHAMADNIGWILSREPPGTRMVVWAHNGHVNYGSEAGYTPMGEWLRQKFGAEYLSIGFVFNQGAFQAMGRTTGLGEFSLGPSPEAGLAAAFSRAGTPLSLLDLRSRPGAGPVAAWLTSPHPMRETGALFSTEEDMTEPVVITDRFDAVLFVDRTTRARPNPRPETGTTKKPGGGSGGGGGDRRRRGGD